MGTTDQDEPFQCSARSCWGLGARLMKPTDQMSLEAIAVVAVRIEHDGRARGDLEAGYGAALRGNRRMRRGSDQGTQKVPRFHLIEHRDHPSPVGTVKK